MTLHYYSGMLAKELHWSIEVLFWLALGTALFTTFWSNNKVREHPDGRVVFAASRINTLAWLFVWGRVVVVGTRSILGGDLHPWTLMLGILFGGGILFSVAQYPGAITVDSEEVVQNYWFKSNRKLKWSEIEEIRIVKGETIRLTGPQETRIVFWSGLPDSSRFLQEIRRHCSGNLPPDFPGETAEHV